MRPERIKERQEHARELPSTASSIDEKAIRLFEPDVFAAEEYRGTRRGRVLYAELELLEGVLEQGSGDYRRYVSARDTKRKSTFSRYRGVARGRRPRLGFFVYQLLRLSRCRPELLAPALARSA